MKRTILLAAILLCCIGSTFAQNTTQKANYIEVSARVSKDIVPDEIYLYIIITEKDNKGKISVEQQEKDMIATLKDLGINVKEALTVNNMGSSLKNNALKKNNIFVSKNYTLKVNSSSLASDVIEGLNNLNIARVGISSISVSDSLEREVKNMLLTEAAQNAQENARILAEAVGCKAGKAIYMQNYYTFDSASNGRMLMKSFAGPQMMDENALIVEEESVELEVTKKSLSITVNCHFLLE